MVIEPGNRAARSIGPSPVSPELETPPLAPIEQVDRMPRGREHQRARPEHVRPRAGIILRVRLDLELALDHRLNELTNPLTKPDFDRVSNQLWRRWTVVPGSDCRAGDTVLVVVIAWSPPAHQRRGCFGFHHSETTPSSIPTTSRT